LTADLREALRSEDDQRNEENNEDLTGSETHDATPNLRRFVAETVASAVAVDTATGASRFVAYPNEGRAHAGAEAVNRVACRVDLTTGALRTPREQRHSEGGTQKRREPKHEKNPTRPVSG
jgi:hypothetical protein